VPGAATWQQQQQQQQRQQQTNPSNSGDFDGSRSNPRLTKASNGQHPSNQQQQQQQQRAVFGSQQLQQLLAEGRLAASLLSKPPYTTTTALLLFAWAATSFAYYGLVQLVAQLHLEVSGPAAAGGAGATCTDESLQVRHLAAL
jgi:hypothetical protein